MSDVEFKPGVYQLHAIDDAGKSQYFDQSGFLRSHEQLKVWFESTCGQHELPEESNWYPLNDSDPRFQIIAVMRQEVEETPSKVEPKKQAPKNAYDVSSEVTNQIVLAHEKNLWAKRNEAKLKSRQNLVNHIMSYYNE
tara:strand:- start:273 stop:686 length:414 start_codon:yes stop_codon:yes gene_type:complete